MIESYLELIGTTHAGHPGARDPARGPGRRRRVARPRRTGRRRGAARADRAGRPGAGGGRGDGARRAGAGPARAGAADRVRPVRACRAGGAARPPIPSRDGLAEANAWPLGAREALGPLPQRRRGARHLLDRRLAAGRRLADVHGRAARPLERGAHRRGHVRAAGARPLDARDRGGGHARPRRPRAAARASASPRPPASARPRRRPCAARPSWPPGHGEVRLSGFVTVSGRDPRRPAPRLRRGARARRAGAAGAAPAVRPAGRRVHVHAAAVPRAAMTGARRRRAARAPLHDPPRPGDLSVRRRRRARRPGRVHRS